MGSAVRRILLRAVTLVMAAITAIVLMMRTDAAAAEVKSLPTQTALNGATVSKTSVTAVALSAYEEEISRILKFDRQVVLMVKAEAHDRIGRLVGFDQQGYQIHAPGIVVSVSEDRTDQVLTALRFKLRSLDYIPFIAEINGGLKIDKIGILKGNDQFEILRIMHTDGDEYDISNEDVIDRLKEWEYICAFDIIGADSDWVEIEFKNLPLNLKSFAEEVYDFSPDTVDQGPGTVDGLVREIMRTNRLFLWWD